MAADRPGEFELIKRFFAPLAKDPGSLGLTDDAAVLKPRPGFDLVLTKDVLAADVHFFAEDAPEAIAAKSLRVNLSDLAAKGATPRGYLLGIALPKGWTADWLERFCKGLAADQAAYDIQLLGGDTIKSSNGLQVSITAIGEVPSRQAVRRCGAKAGDILFATGTIGDAAAGLKARLDRGFAAATTLEASDEARVLGRDLLPRPRTCLAPLIVKYANASMDISDGLLSDTGHMASASSSAIQINLEAVPLSPALTHLKSVAADVFFACLNGGDDYEILVSVPEAVSQAFSAEASELGCPVTAVGRVVEGEAKVHLLDNGVPVSADLQNGFRHF